MLRKPLVLSLAILLLGAQAPAAPHPTVRFAMPVAPPQAPDGERAAPGPLPGVLSYGVGDQVAEADEEFVADAGYPLDYYLFRSDGPIEFHIDITRYFGPVDANGHLLQPENIYTDNGAVDLTLRVWDVDEDYSGSDSAPEVDKVYVNDTYVGTLSGWNDQWSTVTFSIPVSLLRFPRLDGVDTVVPVSNTIRIDIDTANVGECECWAVAVDWARLVLRGVRPTLLVHGFLSSETTWGAWTNPTGFASQEGLHAEAFSFPNNHGSWGVHMSEEAAWVADLKARLGVEKINIVGHSKGGLDSRAYLAFLAGDEVENLVMLGTPNAGSPVADLVKAGSILNPLIGLASLIGEPALTELTVIYMNTVFNSIVGPNPATDYYTVAGDWQGLPNGNPLVPGPDDSVVAVSSVESLPYATALGHTGHLHTEMTAGSQEWGMAWPILQQDAISINLLPGTVPVVSNAGPGSLGISLLEGYDLAGGSQTHGVTLEAGVPNSIGLLWAGATPSVTVTAPDGQAVPAGAAMEGGLLGLSSQLFPIADPQAGSYQVTVSSTEPISYLLVAASEGSPHSISAAPLEPVIPLGNPAILEAAITAPPSSPLFSQIQAHVNGPDGTLTMVTLHDDGQGADPVAGDQIYTGEYLTTQEGFHPVVVTAGSTPLQRITMTGFLVAGGADRLIQVADHHGADLDGDGLFDELMVTVDVATAAGGGYLFSMRLEDAAGMALAQEGGLHSLAQGAGQVTFSFDGQSLGESGFQGDLFLHGAMLRADGQIADVRLPLAVLGGYDASQFEHAPLRLLPGIQEQPVDHDQNGQYDELRLTIPVEAVGGWYNFNARLMDANLQEIAWAGGSGSLVTGQNMITLSFPGEAIGAHGVDGPYYVRDFSLYGGGHSLHRVLLHTTQPYGYGEFEGAVLQDGVLFSSPLDGDEAVTLPAGQEIPIRFRWMQNGQPTLDESVTIRIRNQNNKLIAGYTYGYSISYDASTGEYLQPFNPAAYGMGPGDQARILVYFGGKLQATAVVNLN